MSRRSRTTITLICAYLAGCTGSQVDSSLPDEMEGTKADGSGGAQFCGALLEIEISSDDARASLTNERRGIEVSIDELPAVQGLALLVGEDGSDTEWLAEDADDSYWVCVHGQPLARRGGVNVIDRITRLRVWRNQEAIADWRVPSESNEDNHLRCDEMTWTSSDGPIEGDEVRDTLLACWQEESLCFEGDVEEAAVDVSTLFDYLFDGDRSTDDGALVVGDRVELTSIGENGERTLTVSRCTQ